MGAGSVTWLALFSMFLAFDSDFNFDSDGKEKAALISTAVRRREAMVSPRQLAQSLMAGRLVRYETKCRML